MRSRHSAVCLDTSIIIMGGVGRSKQPLSTREIWKYNLYTEEWKKHVIPYQKEAPEPFYGAIAVVIEGTIHTFGGIGTEGERRNALWTLSRTERGCFTWRFMKYQNEDESPSPRNGHTGWEYAGKLLVFGGVGPSPEEYLNCHGNIAKSNWGLSANNQLLSCNPNTKKWTNLQCVGTVPTPRWCHASAIIGGKVFLFGGCIDNLGCQNDFSQLDMLSLVWTQLGIGHPSPQARHSCSLTATSDNQLVLHGGQSAEGGVLKSTLIMNLTSCSWRQYASFRGPHLHHTATLGLNSNVVIVGGNENFDETYDMDSITNHVKLEPGSLQKIASYTINKHKANPRWKQIQLARSLQEQALFTICMHKADLPWKCLPKKLFTPTITTQITMDDKPRYTSYENCPQEGDIKVLGPDSEHVCIVSKEGDRFAVKQSHAMKSSHLARILTGPGAGEEGKAIEINLTNSFYSTHTLLIVCEYLDYKVKHTLPQWEMPIPDFPIDKEDAIEVLLAANFLDI